ncbi:MAG TPA: hypothetical protein PL163_11545, partial [Leptospiraceae bacterium]|nr:hypothetical protein [Leptospiraceae bacterium]
METILNLYQFVREAKKCFLFLVLLAVINCVTTSRVSSDKEKEIKSKEHGFITIKFRTTGIENDYGYGPVIDGWRVKFLVDQQEFFSDLFKDGEDYTFPVSAGKHSIKYFFERGRLRPFVGTKIYSSRDENQGMSDSDPRTLNIDIQPDTKHTLIFKQSGSPILFKTMTILYLMPWMWWIYPLIWPAGMGPVFHNQEVILVPEIETSV